MCVGGMYLPVFYLNKVILFFYKVLSKVIFFSVMAFNVKSFIILKDMILELTNGQDFRLWIQSSS